MDLFWDKCVRIVSLEELEGLSCWNGWDLSSKMIKLLCTSVLF